MMIQIKFCNTFTSYKNKLSLEFIVRASWCARDAGIYHNIEMSDTTLFLHPDDCVPAFVISVGRQQQGTLAAARVILHTISV
jgi:hypothetical protein